MKKILMTLAITALAYAGVEAQEKKCTCKSTIHKHTVAKHIHKTPAAKTSVEVVGQGTTTQVACKLVPKEVCKISPDRKTVNCYKTTDIETLAPFGSETTTYGSTGPTPGGKKEGFNVPTVVVNENRNMNFCVRNAEARQTICYVQKPGYEIRRGDDGLYYYAYGDDNVKANDKAEPTKTWTPPFLAPNSIVYNK